jgi:hypothetical protein
MMMSDWRLSRSGYSIVTGVGDERRVIAQIPATASKELIQHWIDVAMTIVEKHNAEQKDTQRLDWACRNISGKAWREAGIIYTGCAPFDIRCAIDARLQTASESK